MRSRGPLAVVGLLILSGCLGAAGTPMPSTEPFKPFRLAVFGDSFTAALVPNQGDRNEVSWATGTDPAVNSVLHRIQATQPGAIGSNGAFSGARMQDVPRQAGTVAGGADEVLVWLGINDLCWREPTTTQKFAADTQKAFDLIEASHPSATVVVFTIPDLWKLHELHLGTPKALAFWKDTVYCPGFFSPGLDPRVSLEARAHRLELNAVLAQQATARGFVFSEATEWPGLRLDHFSSVDYFHPDVSGEAALAAAAWPSAAPATAGRVPPLAVFG